MLRNTNWGFLWSLLRILEFLNSQLTAFSLLLSFLFLRGLGLKPCFGSFLFWSSSPSPSPSTDRSLAVFKKLNVVGFGSTYFLSLFIYFWFLGHTDGIQGLLLTLHSEVNPGTLKGPNGIPRFEPGSILYWPYVRQMPYHCALAPASTLIF